MIKKFLIAIFCLMIFVNIAEANEGPRVTVMDLSANRGSISGDFATENIGAMASEYLMAAIWETGKFKVIDWENAESEIVAENLPTSGIITQSAARKIASLLNVDYVIYGDMHNVNSDGLTFEVAGNGGNFKYVKAGISVEIIDVKAGEVILAAHGEGVSKRSEVKGGAKNIFLKIGGQKIPQVCVHNAIYKAANATAEEIAEKFFNN